MSYGKLSFETNTRTDREGRERDDGSFEIALDPWMVDRVRKLYPRNDELGRRAQGAYGRAPMAGRRQMVWFASDKRPLGRSAAFWLIFAPIVLSLVVRTAAVLGCRPCGIDAACLERENVVGMLGAAFPNALGYPVEVVGGAWVLPFLLALDAVFAALLWRLLPPRTGWGTIAALWTGWAVLSVLSVLWVAPALVAWTVMAVS